MKSLVRHIYEKLIINKDYKSLSDDFCDEFGDDIEYVIGESNNMLSMYNDIENALEDTLYERHKRLIVLDLIEKENLFNSGNKIIMAKGYVDVNAFYYELFLRMSAYCEQHKNDKCIRYNEKEVHNSMYVLNTCKYCLVIWGDDCQNERYSSSRILIQEK